MIEPQVAEYAALSRRRGELEGELLAVKARLKLLHDAVLEAFQRDGVDSVRVDGTTLFLRRELWAGREPGVSAERACEALTAAGLGEFVAETYNTQTLSAWCRERDRAGEPLPAALAGVIKVSEVYKVGARVPGARGGESAE